MRSYKQVEWKIPGNSTKRPTVGNDTGTPRGPHGTGANAEGSVGGTYPCAPQERRNDKGKTHTT